MKLYPTSSQVNGILGRTIVKTSLTDSPTALLTACLKLSPNDNISRFLLNIM